MQYTVTKAMKKYKWMHATRKKDPNEISPELTFPEIFRKISANPEFPENLQPYSSVYRLGLLRQTLYPVWWSVCLVGGWSGGHKMRCEETAGRIEVALGMGLGLGQCSIIPEWEPNTCVYSGEAVHHWYGNWP